MSHAIPMIRRFYGRKRRDLSATNGRPLAYHVTLNAAQRKRLAAALAEDCGWPSLEAMRRTMLAIPRRPSLPIQRWKIQKDAATNGRTQGRT